MSKLKRFVSPLILLLLLVGMPAVSWIYLKRGFEYRKAAILTQGDFGKMPDLSRLERVWPPSDLVYGPDGQVPAYEPEALRGSMVVVGWLDPTKEVPSRLYGTMLDSLYQQFAGSANLEFITVLLADDPTGEAERFTIANNIPPNDMVTFLRADARNFQRSAEQFNLPLSEYDAPGSEPIVALVDSSQTIVKHYNLARRDETVGLVELISVIIPLEERQDIVVDRAREL